jgi:hypothetical protein
MSAKLLEHRNEHVRSIAISRLQNLARNGVRHPHTILFGALAAVIPPLIKLLEHNSWDTQRSVGDLLLELAKYGERHLNSSYTALMCLKPSFVKY